MKFKKNAQYNSIVWHKRAIVIAIVIAFWKDELKLGRSLYILVSTLSQENSHYRTDSTPDPLDTIPVYWQYWHIGCLQAELKIKVYSGSLKTFNSSYCFWNKYYSETYNVRGCELRQVCLPEEPGYVVEGEREEHVAVEGVAGTPEAGPPHQHHQGEEQRHQGGRQQPHPHLHTNPHNTHYLVLSSSVL